MPRVDRAATPAGFIDLTVNRPAVDDFRKRLAETLPQLAADKRFREMQEYQPPEGPAWARAAGRALDCAQRLRAFRRRHRRDQRRPACAAGGDQRPDRAGRRRRFGPADLLRAEGAGADVPVSHRRHRQRRTGHVGGGAGSGLPARKGEGRLHRAVDAQSERGDDERDAPARTGRHRGAPRPHHHRGRRLRPDAGHARRRRSSRLRPSAPTISRRCPRRSRPACASAISPARPARRW